MIALQSAAGTPDLGPPLVAWALACALALVVGAAGSAVARRLSNPVVKYRLLYAAVVLPLGLFAYGLLSLLDTGAALRGAVVGASTGVVAADVFLAEFLTVSAAGAVALAAYAPTVRGLVAVRGIDLRTGRALARLGRWLLGLAVAFALAVTPFRLGIGDGASTVAVSLGVVTVVVALLAGSPWAIVAVRSTRRPTAEAVARIDRLRERAGLGPGVVRDVRVVDTDDEGTATALVRGLGPTRRLFVTSTFLEAFDDDTAAALLAVQAGRVRSRALSRRMGAVVVAAVPLIAGVSGDGPLGPLVAAAGIGLLSGFWYARRGVVAADDRAAERVGADAVADALERYASVHALEPPRRRVPNPFSVNVALGDRIDRLRDRSTDPERPDDGATGADD